MKMNGENLLGIFRKKTKKKKNVACPECLLFDDYLISVKWFGGRFGFDEYVCVCMCVENARGRLNEVAKA